MRSTRAFRFNTSGSACNFVHTFASSIGSPATLVARLYLYFASLPDRTLDLFSETTSVANYGLYFVQSDNTLRAGRATAQAGSGITVTTGQWYRVDLKIVLDTTRTVDLQVDGVAATQYSLASSASAISGIQVGTGTSLATMDVYLDDLIVSGVSGDFPIGAGTVYGLYPTSDGSHNFNANNDFLRDGTTNLNVGATDAWTELQNPLSTTVGSFLTAANNATSEYVRCRFENLPADALTVNGVAVVSTNHAASATACAHDLLIVDDSATSGTSVASEINHLGSWGAGVFGTGVDLSETTITVPYTCAASGATTGAWTVANVNDLAAIFGGTDVNPDAHFDGVCLEVDYVQASAKAAPFPAPRIRPVLLRAR